MQKYVEFVYSLFRRLPCLVKILPMIVMGVVLTMNLSITANAEEVQGNAQVYDVSGYSWCEYVPGPYNLEKDVDGYSVNTTLADFYGDEDAYMRWCSSWSLKKVWIAPNGHMVKMRNFINLSDEQMVALGGMGSYQDVYGCFGETVEDKRAMAYWAYGDKIDAGLGTNQEQRLPAVTSSASWAKIGTLDSIFGSSEMVAYDKVLAGILYSMENMGETSDKARATYGIRYSSNHVSLCKLIDQNDPKYFDVRLYEAGMNSFVKDTYINIQLYKYPPEELTQVEWRTLRDILKKLTPCGDAVCDDIYAVMYTGIPEIVNYDTWYARNGYSLWVTDVFSNPDMQGCIEFKIKP